MMVISWDLPKQQPSLWDPAGGVKNCPNFAIETMWVELEVIQKRTFQKARRLFLDIQGVTPNYHLVLEIKCHHFWTGK